MQERIQQGLIHFGLDETTVPNNKTYLANTLTQSLTSIKYKDGRVASKQLNALMGGAYFTNPKDVGLLKTLFTAIGLESNDIVLDFFSGSASTAEAVMEISAETSMPIRYIMVQIQEDLDKALSKAVGSAKQVLMNAIKLCKKMGRPHYLTEIGKERIRRAARKIREEAGLALPQGFDGGFRCLRLDSSNMQDVYYNPSAMTQDLLALTTDNIKPDRTPEDLLFQVMLDLGIDLSSAIEETEIAGCKVFNVADGFLLACFDKGVDTSAVTGIAKKKPYYAVFRDSGMADDSTAANFDQIFRTYSPATVRKVL